MREAGECSHLREALVKPGDLWRHRNHLLRWCCHCMMLYSTGRDNLMLDESSGADAHQRGAVARYQSATAGPTSLTRRAASG